MLERIRGIENAVKEKTYRDYQRSWLLRSAVERGIEIISEASRHVGCELKSAHKDVRWRDIAGIGNSLRHEYQRVDTRVIWQALKDHLPPLNEALLAMQAVLEEQYRVGQRNLPKPV